MVCFNPMGVLRIAKDKSKISTGTLELINKAFVAVVFCKAKYKIVLNPVIPSNARRFSISQCCLMVSSIIFKFFINIGTKNKLTNPQRKNASCKGSISR